MFESIVRQEEKKQSPLDLLAPGARATPAGTLGGSIAGGGRIWPAGHALSAPDPSSRRRSGGRGGAGGRAGNVIDASRRKTC